MDRLIYICVEGKARELMGKCMLASLFLGRGYKVVIGNHNILRRMAAEGTPGVLVDKDFSEMHAENWKMIHQNAGKAYALDEEGIFQFSENEYMYRVGKDSVREADGIFLWGTNHKEMVEKLGGTEGKLYIVGNPRMDILGKNLDIFYRDEAEEYSKKYGEYVLANIGFCVGVKAEEIVGTVEMHSDRKMEEKEVENIKLQYKIYKKLFEVFCDGVEAIARQIPNKIIVRPHPSDPSFDRWKNRFKDINNIEVIRTGDANSWISKAEMMVHPGCTTSLEAYVSGKPTVILNPFEEVNHPLLSEISVRADNPEELVQIVKDFLDTKDAARFFNRHSEEIINRFVCIDKAKYACEKIADIVETNEFSSRIPRVKRCRNLHDVKQELVLKRYAMTSHESQPKFGYTKSEEIKKNLEAGNEVFHQSFDINVKRINANVFECIRA